MIYFTFIFVSLIFLCISPVDPAFRTEEIVGGYSSCLPTVRYQAAILGKYKTTFIPSLLCGAAIIDNYLLLSAAQCFINRDNRLRAYTFFAVVGEFSISQDSALRDIELVYSYHYDPLRGHNNIAVVKLKESLELEINRLSLFRLEIPNPFHDFGDFSGKVAGFGAKSLDDPSMYDTRERVQLNNGELHEITDARVEVHTDPEVCQRAFPKDSMETTFCGIIKPDDVKKHRGLCVGDFGTPFVIDRYAVGIASKRNRDCDDTKDGALYTNVSQFHGFINSVKRGHPIFDTTINYNPPFAPSAVSVH